MLPHSYLARLREWLFGPQVVAAANVATLVCGPLHVTRHIPLAMSSDRQPAGKAPASQPAAAIESLPLDVFSTPDDLPEPEVAPAADSEPVRECQWCDAIVPPDAVFCPACGSSVQGDTAQAIPGLTELTEAQMEELDRPLRLPRGATGDALLAVLVDELGVGDEGRAS